MYIPYVLIVDETIWQTEFIVNILRYRIANYFFVGLVLPRLIPNDNWTRMPAAVVDHGWVGLGLGGLFTDGQWWLSVDIGIQFAWSRSMYIIPKSI